MFSIMVNRLVRWEKEFEKRPVTEIVLILCLVFYTCILAGIFINRLFPALDLIEYVNQL